MSCIAAALLVAGTAPPCRAEFSAVPGISVREDYNDNIFMTHTGKVDDYITTVSPFLRLSYLRSDVKLDLNYGLNFIYYIKNPVKNETSLDQAQKAKLDTTVTLLRNNLFVKLIDEYVRVPIDRRRQVTLADTFVNQTDTNRFTGNPYWEYQASGTTKFRLGYSYQNFWYRDVLGDSLENHTATASLSKELSPNLSLTASYAYLWHRPTRTESYDNQNPSLGANWQITPKLTLSGSAGRTFFQYQSPLHPDSASIIWQAQANYLLKESLMLSAGYAENFADNVTLGTSKNSSSTASLSYNGRVQLRLSGHRTDSSYTDIVREDIFTGASFDSSLPLTQRLTALWAGSYESYKYLPEREHGNRYSTKLSFEYQLKIMTVSLGYIFNANESSIDTNSYTNNIIFGQAKFTY